MFEESVSSIPSIWASMNSWFTPTVLFVLLNLMIGTIAITSSLGSQKHHEQQHQENGDSLQARQLARSPSVLQRLKSINFYSYRSQEPTTAFQKSPETETNYAFRQNPEQDQSNFARSPSSMLQKLKSINLYSYISQEFSPPSQPTAGPEPTAHFDFQHTPTEPHQEEEKEEEGEDEEEQIEKGRDKFEDGDQTQTLDEIYSQLKGSEAHAVSRSKSDTKPTLGEAPPAKLSRKMKKSASAKSAFAHFEEADVESRRPATVREGKAKMTEVDDDEVDAKADDFINRFKQQLKLQRLDSIIRYKDMISRGSDK